MWIRHIQMLRIDTSKRTRDCPETLSDSEAFVTIVEDNFLYSKRSNNFQDGRPTAKGFLSHALNCL
jgi:hypothetical protein